LDGLGRLTAIDPLTNQVGIKDGHGQPFRSQGAGSHQNGIRQRHLLFEVGAIGCAAKAAGGAVGIANFAVGGDGKHHRDARSIVHPKLQTNWLTAVVETP
jgi:hypothetical protein